MSKVSSRVSATCWLWPHQKVHDHCFCLQSLLAKKLVPSNRIASQPPQGWYGGQTNQSIKALKWFSKVRTSTSSPLLTQYCICNARNKGDVCVANHLVNGLDLCDPVTVRPSIYEFHGCLWHGCPRCFPVNCDRHLIFHTDCTMQDVYKHTLRKHYYYY